MNKSSLVAETIDGWSLEIKRLRIHLNAKPVILWHGLSTCHRIFTINSDLNTKGANCQGLAEYLAARGFDVFMGNSRGNKFTSHRDYSESDREYWEFSLDQGALDVQAVVDKVLNVTGHKSCIYIGFSQGSAIGLAALSLFQELNHKISHFVGLAPAMKPKSWNESITGFIDKWGAHRLEWVFGGKSFLPVAGLVSDKFPAQITKTIIKNLITNVLGWKLEGYGDTQRELYLYRNIFGTTSTRIFIHWFQILGAGKFQLYDRRHLSTFSPTNPAPSTPPIQFPTNHITTKISLYCGQADNLSDPTYLSTKLPHAKITMIKDYEHLDLIWSTDAEDKWGLVVEDIGDAFLKEVGGLTNVICLGDIPAAYL